MYSHYGPNLSMEKSVWIVTEKSDKLLKSEICVKTSKSQVIQGDELDMSVRSSPLKWKCFCSDITLTGDHLPDSQFPS